MSKNKKKSKFSLEIPTGAEYQLWPVPLVADGAIAQNNSALGHLFPF